MQVESLKDLEIVCHLKMEVHVHILLLFVTWINSLDYIIVDFMLLCVLCKLTLLNNKVLIKYLTIDLF